MRRISSPTTPLLGPKQYVAARPLRKRALWVEPLFGEAKDWHGLCRFQLRGLAKVNIQALLVAAGQNLKRWLTATRWKRHSPPGGSLALPVAAS